MKRKSSPEMLRLAKISIVTVFCLLLAFAIANLAQAAPAMQRGVVTFRLSYDMIVGPRQTALCTGQTETISVALYRNLVPTVSGFMSQASFELVNGARIQGNNIGNSSVGDFEPVNSLVTNIIPGNQGQAVAQFYFVAGEPGTTTLEFKVIDTGEVQRFGQVAVPKKTVSVEVVPCFEAYSSALITQWIKKDACSMRRPFTLTGPSQSRTGLVSLMTTASFTPTSAVIRQSETETRGTYNVISRWKGLTETSNGQWVVHVPADTDSGEFVEILLNGVGFGVYDNGVVTTDPNPTEALYLIELQAVSSPDLCPGN